MWEYVALFPKTQVLLKSVTFQDNKDNKLGFTCRPGQVICVVDRERTNCNAGKLPVVLQRCGIVTLWHCMQQYPVEANSRWNEQNSLLCEFLVNKSYQLHKLANISLSPNLNHSWPFFPVCSIHLIFWNVTGHKNSFSTPSYLFKASPLSPTSGDWLDVGEFCDGYLKSFLWPLNILALWAINMQEKTTKWYISLVEVHQ